MFLVQVSQNCFDSFNCSNQTGAQISKPSFSQDKLKKDRFKVFVNLSEWNLDVISELQLT